MSYNPYGGKYTYGGTLKHYRRAISDGGSPNGYRKDGSQPTGKKRMGRIVGQRPDGTLIYEYPTSMGQRNRNAERLRTAVTGEDRRGRGGDPTARAQQQRRITSAIATNAGARGISSREEQQRKGNRINANLHGNTLGNKIGNASLAVSANGRKAVNDTKKFVRNTAKNAPNIFQRGASAIGDWFSKRRDDLRTAGKSVGNWLKDRGQNIRDIGKTAYDAISNSDEREAYERANANYRKNPTAENRKARDNAKRAYDSHLLTRLDRGVKNTSGKLSKAAKNVGNSISNQDEREAYERAQANYRKNPTAENRKARDNAKRAYDSHLLTRLDRGAKSASRKLSKAAGKTSDLVANTARDAKDFVSNQDEREAYERANANYDKLPQGKAKLDAYYEKEKRRKAYESHPLTKAEKAVSGVAGTIRDKAGQVTEIPKRLEQNNKNRVSAKGGREAQQQKGNQLTAKRGQERARVAESEYNEAKNRMKELSDVMDKFSRDDPEFYNAQQRYNDYYNNTYLPRLNAYNRTKSKR